jgi:hypothetical protein
MVLSLLITIVALIIVNLLLAKSRDQLAIKYTDFGRLAVSCLANIPLALSLCWQLGVWLRKESNFGLDPALAGIGGAEYGIDFDTYAEVALIKGLGSIILCIGTIIMAFLTQGNLGDSRTLGLDYIKKIGSVGPRNRIVLYLLTFLAITAYFSTVGIGILFASELNRFELGTTRISVAIIRISFLMTLVTSIAVSLYTFVNGVTVGSIICQLLLALPAVLSASRGFTLLSSLFVASIYFRFPRRNRIALAPVMVLVFMYLYMIPLIQRDDSEEFKRGGLASVFLAVQESVSLNPLELIATVMVNLGQGFGVVAEVYSESGDSGYAIGVPWQYFALQLSPLPSFIDGYDRDWMEYNPRINEYTPISFTGHWMLLSNVAGVLVYPVVCLFTLFTLKVLTSRTYAAPVMGCFFVCAAVFSLVSEQYPPRNGLRFLELALVAALIARLFIKVPPQPSRNETTTQVHH